MQFGNAIFLWGLLAVPLPIIIHLYFRRNRIRVKFSTTQFFRKREKVLAFRRKLRDILLLVLRTLSILLLVLALSMPVLSSFKYISGGRTDAVIILDDTLSMCRKGSSGQTAYDYARKKAQEITGTLGGGDSAALILLSGGKGISLTHNIQKVGDAVRNSSPSGATGSYSGALKKAAECLAASETPNHEIYLISDFQTNQVPSQPYNNDELRKSRIYFIPVAGTLENLSVTRVFTGFKPKTVNKAIKIEFDVDNFGKGERQTEVNLEVNGKLIETRDISLKSGAKLSGEFSYVPVSEGMLTGTVNVKDDFLGLDNSRYFAVSVSKNVRVLAVYEDEFVKQDPYFYIRHALDPDGSAGNGISMWTATLKELSPKMLSGSHIILLADIGSVSGKAASMFAEYLKKGGTIISFPGNKTGPGTFSEMCEILKKEGIQANNFYGKKEPFKKNGIVFYEDFAIMNDLLQLDYLAWKNIQEMPASPSQKVLAATNGRNVIVEQKLGNGRLIALACSARTDYCNWPELKSFPVAMVHLIDHAANGIADVKSLVCGNKLGLNPYYGTITVSGYSGAQNFEVAKGVPFFFENTWSPGILNIDGADIKALVLNADTGEGKLDVLPREKIPKAVVEHEVNMLNPDSAIDEQVNSSRIGSDLSGLFFVLLFLSLVLEFLISYNLLDYFRVPIRRKGEIT
jgi:hypothetical protein